MNWQNRYLLLILPILLLSIKTDAYQKISSPLSDKILNFTLFNYDNLIADHYENRDLYITQLTYLLSQATGQSTENYQLILNSPELTTEPYPVQYMLKLNRQLKLSSGYYFVDD